MKRVRWVVAALLPFLALVIAMIALAVTLAHR